MELRAHQSRCENVTLFSELRSEQGLALREVLGANAQLQSPFRLDALCLNSQLPSVQGGLPFPEL